MIGFIHSSDIPKIAISFGIGVVLFCAVGFTVEHFLPNGGNVAAGLLLGGLAMAGYASYWAGGFIWEHIQNRS